MNADLKRAGEGHLQYLQNEEEIRDLLQQQDDKMIILNKQESGRQSRVAELQVAANQPDK